MSCLNYDDFIKNILKTRGRFGIPKSEYKERHHIVPKCLGGNNDKLNLIDLYAKEHYIAHKLLALENPTNSGLVYAWNKMCKCKSKNQKRNYIVTDEDYEKLKIILHNVQIKKVLSKETKEKMSNSHKGKISKLRGIPRTLEVKQKISNSKKRLRGKSKRKKIHE